MNRVSYKRKSQRGAMGIALVFILAVCAGMILYMQKQNIENLLLPLFDIEARNSGNDANLNAFAVAGALLSDPLHATLFQDPYYPLNKLSIKLMPAAKGLSSDPKGNWSFSYDPATLQVYSWSFNRSPVGRKLGSTITFDTGTTDTFVPQSLPPADTWGKRRLVNGCEASTQLMTFINVNAQSNPLVKSSPGQTSDRRKNVVASARLPVQVPPPPVNCEIQTQGFQKRNYPLAENGNAAVQSNSLPTEFELPVQCNSDLKLAFVCDGLISDATAYAKKNSALINPDLVQPKCDNNVPYADGASISSRDTALSPNPTTLTVKQCDIITLAAWNPGGLASYRLKITVKCSSSADEKVCICKSDC